MGQQAPWAVSEIEHTVFIEVLDCAHTMCKRLLWGFCEEAGVVERGEGKSWSHGKFPVLSFLRPPDELLQPPIKHRLPWFPEAESERAVHRRGKVLAPPPNFSIFLIREVRYNGTGQSFQYLILLTARKLRDEWITKQKIKNAYRAQKRRGGPPLNSALPKVSQSQDSGDHNSGDDSGGDEGAKEDEVARAFSQSASPPPNPRSLQLSERQRHTLTSRTNASSSSSHSVHPASLNCKTTQETASATRFHDDKVARARELLREAYSPASLHTFKSEPLHKRDPRNAQGGRARGRGRGVGRGGPGRTTGRGQPDMRKRMGALLAQIEAHQ